MIKEMDFYRASNTKSGNHDSCIVAIWRVQSVISVSAFCKSRLFALVVQMMLDFERGAQDHFC